MKGADDKKAEMSVETQDENSISDSIKQENDTETVKKESTSDSKFKDSKSQTSSSEVKHKFNVKVLLISIPPLVEIYERLFGSEFHSIGSVTSGSNQSSNKSQVSHFHKLFSLLVSRNTNDGYSLIGGKFNKEQDGYLPQTNEPNLISTAIRIVYEQTGLNLSSCRQWRVFCTFIYNRDTTLNQDEAAYEVTKIYFPDLWSALDNIYAPLHGVSVLDEVSVSNSDPCDKNEVEVGNQPEQQDNDLMVNDSKETESQPTERKIESEFSSGKVDSIFIKDVSNDQKRNYLEQTLISINNFKVSDLKNELDRLDVKYESKWKKEQLYQRLKQVLEEYLKTLNSHQTESDEMEVKDEIQAEDDHTVDESTEGKPDEMETEQENDAQEQKSKQASLNDSTADVEANEEKLNLKRKSNESDESCKTENDHDLVSKKIKVEFDDKKSIEQKPMTLNGTLSNLNVKGNLSTVSLQTALTPHKFDQFELVVVAELLRDSLTIHFARYILSAIIHNINSKKSTTIGSQESRVIHSNYVHLAFSYFDKGHCGYIHSDELNTLLNNTGFTISRKTFNQLVSSLMQLVNPTTGSVSLLTSFISERIVYLFFEQPLTLIPLQTEHSSIQYLTPIDSSSTSKLSKIDDIGLIVERNSIQYNIDELIKQSGNDQKTKVRLSDSLAEATKKIGMVLSAKILFNSNF